MTAAPLRMPVLFALGLVLLGSLVGIAHAHTGNTAAVRLAFEYNHEEYRDRKTQRDWPRWVTVLLTVRNPQKRRPLYLYGRNESGTLTLSFDDMAGLSDGYNVHVKGEAVIAVNRYSATRALDVEDFAAADWLRADPNPTIRIRITSFDNFEDKNQGMAELLSPTRKSDPRSREKRRAIYTATMHGEIQVDDTRAPFQTPVELTIRESETYYSLSLEGTIDVKGATLGLTGGDAEETLSLRLLSTAFSAFPKTQRAPTLDSMDMDMNMDLGLD